MRGLSGVPLAAGSAGWAVATVVSGATAVRAAVGVAGTAVGVVAGLDWHPARPVAANILTSTRLRNRLWTEDSVAKRGLFVRREERWSFLTNE